MSKRARAARPNRRQRPQPGAAAQRAATPARAAATTEAAQAPAVAAVTPGQATAIAQPTPAPRAATSRPQARTANRPSTLLAQKAAVEYVYVAQDLRRIGTFAGGVAILMVLVWLLVDFAHVITL